MSRGFRSGDRTGLSVKSEPGRAPPWPHRRRAIQEQPCERFEHWTVTCSTHGYQCEALIMCSSDSNIVWHSYWRMAAEGRYGGARSRLVAARERLFDPEWAQRMRPGDQQELAKL